MKSITLIFLLFYTIASIATYPKSKYQKNDHVIYDVKKENGYYMIDYTFMDQTSNMVNIHLKFNESQVNKDIEKFGIPKSLLDEFEITPEAEAYRAETLKNGFFKVTGNNIVIDMNAAVNYYAPGYCKPIAEMLIENLRKNNLDTRHHRIEIAMKFTQDIPYAIPDNYEKKKYTGGALCPPELLVEGYGDCDSKTILFAGILAYMINPNDILFVGQTNHMLAAIENESIPGGTHFNFDEKKYYIAETAGPGRHAFGEKGKDFQSAANFEKLIFNHVVNTPPTKNKETKLSTDNKYFTLQIENLCKYTVKLIIRYKNIKGEWVFSDWTTLQKKDISSPLSTQEKYFYLYAEKKK